jgi:hypothetical protein
MTLDGMTGKRDRNNQFCALEGRSVSVALTDGSCIDAQLISAGRQGLQTIWVVISGIDVFLPLIDVIDVWEPARGQGVAA